MYVFIRYLKHNIMGSSYNVFDSSKVGKNYVITTGSSLTLAKMLRAEKCKQQAKMKKKNIDNH